MDTRPQQKPPENREEQVKAMLLAVAAHARKKCENCFGTGLANYIHPMHRDQRYRGICICAWKRFEHRNSAYLYANRLLKPANKRGGTPKTLLGTWLENYSWDKWIQDNSPDVHSLAAAAVAGSDRVTIPTTRAVPQSTSLPSGAAQ